MKTPHTITLYRTKGIKKYDPITDTWIEPYTEAVEVPCLANFITQAKAFELYGDRTNQTLIVRFSQEQAPFFRAEFHGQMFTPIERIDAPIKHAIRLQGVEHGEI